MTKKQKDSPVTYSDAGVDIIRGDDFVDAISGFAKQTLNSNVLSGIGGFASLFSLDLSKFPAPLLVGTTDGVGTKLKIAFLADKHDTVGIDLVAMSVNDLLCVGAEPLFFLDYFATGKIEQSVGVNVLKGIAEGCKEGGMALVGGETAEMPGMYAEGEYDLAGFAVGIVNKGSELPRLSEIKAGDLLLGAESSGVHSNGYSLVRRVVFERAKLKVTDKFPGDPQGKTVADVLLTPTRIYTKMTKAWKDAGVTPKALAHITGSGIAGNLERVLPTGMKARVEKAKLNTPQVFEGLAKLGPVEEEEMFRTFNMGAGMIAVCDQNNADKLVTVAQKAGYPVNIIGEITLASKSTLPSVELL